MTVQLTDEAISELEGKGRLVRCIAVVCRVCGFRQHTSGAYLPAHERCPKGCTLPIQPGECRVCGDPTQSPTLSFCLTHNYGKYSRYGVGCYTTQVAETHWHTADRTGPASQYAVPS